MIRESQTYTEREGERERRGEMGRWIVWEKQSESDCNAMGMRAIKGESGKTFWSKSEGELARELQRE